MTSFANLCDITADFWRHHPALLYGIATLIGASLALYSIWLPVLALLLIAISFPALKFERQQRSAHIRVALAIFFAAASFLLAGVRYQFPDVLPLKSGIADVDITSVSTSRTPFGNVWSYKGTLNSYHLNDKVVAKGFPVRIAIPNEKHAYRPQAGLRYQFQGTLKQSDQGSYSLTPVRNKPWLPIDHFSNLAEWRYLAKSGLLLHLQNSISDTHVRAFLAGIVTGEFDDKILAAELGRFGLQHLMAISGLHFSILSALLGVALCLFLPRRAAAILLITFMTLYFIFLGSSPSVTRAWISISLALAALFVGRQSLALNSLGIALVVVVLLNPIAIQDIGFQFSFGVTASILLWFSPMDDLLMKIFPKRTLSQTIKMDLWDQHGYCILCFIRQAFALCLAVNIVALPLTLYHFHKFPVMSLIYNLFFPPLVSISLLLLILAFSSALLFPWLASQLHALNEYYTQTLLNFTFHLPKTLDLAWRIDDLSHEFIVAYLVTIFFAGTVVKQTQKVKSE